MPTNDEIMTFSYAIESIVHKKQVPYMDAILLYCEESGMEIEMSAKLISGSIKAKIQLEAEDLNFLPRSNTARLPF
jgi:hypothetical protein